VEPHALPIEFRPSWIYRRYRRPEAQPGDGCHESYRRLGDHLFDRSRGLVGGIARENVLEQHVRRLSLETDQLSSDLGQTLATHLGAVRTAGAILRAGELSSRSHGLSDVFDQLVSAYPQLDWIAIADPTGIVVSATGELPIGSRVNASPWFTAGRQGPWIGVIEDMPRSARGAQRTRVSAR